MAEVGWTEEEYTPAVGRLHAELLREREALREAEEELAKIKREATRSDGSLVSSWADDLDALARERGARERLEEALGEIASRAGLDSTHSGSPLSELDCRRMAREALRAVGEKE